MNKKKGQSVKTPEEIYPEPMRTILRKALRSLGVECAGTLQDARRWSYSDLATDLAPLVIKELRKKGFQCLPQLKT